MCQRSLMGGSHHCVFSVQLQTCFFLCFYYSKTVKSSIMMIDDLNTHLGTLQPKPQRLPGKN